MLEVDLHKTLSGPAGDFRLAVQFTVMPGEVLALFGPSGAGKTTALRLIAGLTDPDGGTLRFAGADWLKVRPARRNIGFVFQDPALFPNMTVAENLDFAGAAAPDPVFGLEELMDKYPHQLSGGQRQRVSGARTQVRGTVLLLLDEPLSALDRKARQSIGRFLKGAVKKQGIAAVLVSHDREEVLALADRVALMDNGRITAVGEPAELLLGAVREGVVTGTVLAIHDKYLIVRVGEQRFHCPIPDYPIVIGEQIDFDLRPH